MKQKFKVGEKVRVQFNRFDSEGVIVAYLGGASEEYVVNFGMGFYLYTYQHKDTETSLRKLIFPGCYISKETKAVTFVYEKSPYDISRRTVEVQEENAEYLCGLDVDDNYAFKKFLKAKIVGPVKTA